jgi:hypothetical protein
VVKLHEIATKIHKIKSSVVDGMGTDMKHSFRALLAGSASRDVPLSRPSPADVSYVEDLFGQLLMNFQRISFTPRCRLGTGQGLISITSQRRFRIFGQLLPSRLSLIVQDVRLSS